MEDKFRFELRYSFDIFDSTSCKCRISVKPDECRGSTLKLLQLLNRSHHHEENGDFHLEIEAISWNNLIQKVEKTVASITKQLKQIKITFNDLSALQPKDESFVIEI